MTADLVISQLLLLDAEDSERDITLFINSPGGSITAGMFVPIWTFSVWISSFQILKCFFCRDGNI
jgi:hypothetical protein